MARQLGDKLAVLKKWEDAGSDPIFFRAPAVLVALTLRNDGSAKDNAVHALYNVELAARRIGLATCQMGYMQFALGRSRILCDFFSLPKDKAAQAVLAIGYPNVVYPQSSAKKAAADYLVRLRPRGHLPRSPSKS
jgi:nitroreductase